jgi:hypothetical protein
MKIVFAAIPAILGLVALLPGSAGQSPAAKSSSVPSYFQVVNAVPRFQIITIHPSGVREDSVLLDTKTGCTWAYAVSKHGGFDWDFTALDSFPGDNAFNMQQGACELAAAAAVSSEQPRTPSK